MALSRKELNKLRRELDAVSPGKTNEPLPPQPFLQQTHGARESIIIRGARKIDRATKRIPTGRRTIARLRHANCERHISAQHQKMIDRFRFDTPEKVDVSIVIPVFNKFDLTIECLRSIYENVSSEFTYEVIVVDNASTDATNSLKLLGGLKYIRNPKNMGFVDGCNIGARHAKGQYLIFLNNDTIVMQDWLEMLIKTIKNQPNAGLVGSKILYPDGRLQEAGGVIFSDGSGWNYGKNDHPDRYQYNYVRDVDYISGASIIIKKELFDTFGGFDEIYAPAYYEDTDLAFKVRAKGLRVIYQPESVVYHIEGATAGTSTSSGFKMYQDINRPKFLERWSEVLSTSHYAPKPKNLLLARDRRANKCALIVDEHIPTPDKDSGSVRMSRIIDALQELGYKVTFYPNFTGKKPKYMKPLQQKGVEVVYGEVPFNEFIKERGEMYNAVILSRPRIGSYYTDQCQAYCTNAKIIYDTVDLHYLRLGRQAEFESGKNKTYLKDMAKKHELLEKHLISEADATLVVSQAEVELLNKEGFHNVHIVSNIHEVKDSAYAKGFNDRKDLLFVGGYAHIPNIDAVKWFADKILPLVLKEIPGIKFHVVGSDMPDSLKQHLSGKKGIIIDGFVRDLEPLLLKTRIMVAPLRYGAGVKGKIGQAVEYGIPVVSTTIGAEGMFLADKKSCLTADRPEDFAKAIIKLYKDDILWENIRYGAKEAIEKHFSSAAAKHSLKSLLHQ